MGDFPNRREGMSWFRKKPAVISLTELLQRHEYMEDFVAAQQESEQAMAKNPLLVQVAKCSDLQAQVVHCMQERASNDAKCLLLHQSWMTCAASEVVPQLASQFVTCARRNAGRPEQCEREYQRMWDGVISVMQKSERTVKKDLLSEEEGEIILDCKMLKEAADNAMRTNEDADAALDTWMRCTVPRVCKSEWQSMQKCMDANSGSLDSCIDVGRPLVGCLSDFTMRYGRSLQ